METHKFWISLYNPILASYCSMGFRLDCQPTQGLSSSFCPAAKCGDMFLGNTSSSTSSCESTACSYAGYTNSTSFAILANVTTSNVCNGEWVGHRFCLQDPIAIMFCAFGNWRQCSCLSCCRWPLCCFCHWQLGWLRRRSRLTLRRFGWSRCGWDGRSWLPCLSSRCLSSSRLSAAKDWTLSPSVCR
jgi:hypothetical protein